MDPFALMLVLSATMCWGLAQVIGKLALKNMSTILFNAVRLSITVPIVLFPVLLSGGLGCLDGLVVGIATVSALLGLFFAAHLFFYSIKREDAIRIIPAGNTHPFWMIALAPLLLNEELKLVLPVSAILIFVGTFLLFPGKKNHAHWKFGVPVASFAAFLWGFSTIMDKFCLNADMAVSTLVFIKMLTAAVFFDVTAWVTGKRERLKFSRKSLQLSIISGILAFPVGSFLYSTALNMEQAGTLAPLSGTTIFFGFLFSVLLLREKPTKKSVLGTLLVLVGVLLMV
ncbi:MAG: hypothetical protein DRN83_00840 [Hadesarchaea archaeon]|nr:MAG: hypothetical protein DRN83_00840 [Hadesarchaea archaeon]